MKSSEKQDEQPQNRKLKSGICIVPRKIEEGDSWSEDHALPLLRGHVVCDGVGFHGEARRTAVIVSNVIRSISSQILNVIQSDQEHEDKMGEMLATASAHLVLRVSNHESATTVDIVTIDEKKRLHVAHRGDGMVVRVNPNEETAEVITMPDILPDSLDDWLRDYVWAFGTLSEWGFATHQEMLEFEEKLKKLKSRKRKEELLKWLEEKSKFPKEITRFGKVVNVHEMIANIASKKIKSQELQLSDDTKFYHTDCQEGDLIITMSDGVLDNIIWLLRHKELLNLGFEKNVAMDITRDLRNTEGEDRRRKRSLKRIIDIFKNHFGETAWEEKFNSWYINLSDMDSWYRKVAKRIRNTVRKLAEKNKGVIDPQKVAERIVELTGNKVKRDDATCAVTLVE